MALAVEVAAVLAVAVAVVAVLALAVAAVLVVAVVAVLAQALAVAQTPPAIPPREAQSLRSLKLRGGPGLRASVSERGNPLLQPSAP